MEYVDSKAQVTKYLVVGPPKIELWNEANDKLIYCVEDVIEYSYDINTDMIYVNVGYKPKYNDILVDRYVMKLSFEQYKDTMPPRLAPIQIDDYVELHQVEYLGYYLAEADFNSYVTWRHRFLVYPRG